MAGWTTRWLFIVSVLELIADEADLTQDALEDDSRDFLVAQKELDVAALIEDEIILALSLTPRHEDLARCLVAVRAEPRNQLLQRLPRSRARFSQRF